MRFKADKEKESDNPEFENYDQAKCWSRCNPGRVITRSESGGFKALPVGKSTYSNSKETTARRSLQRTEHNIHEIETIRKHNVFLQKMLVQEQSKVLQIQEAHSKEIAATTEPLKYQVAKMHSEHEKIVAKHQATRDSLLKQFHTVQKRFLEADTLVRQQQEKMKEHEELLDAFGDRQIAEARQAIKELKGLKIQESVATRSAQRKRTECKCLGEVESCHFCYGCGYVIRDGNGKDVT